MNARGNTNRPTGDRAARQDIPSQLNYPANSQIADPTQDGAARRQVQAGLSEQQIQKSVFAHLRARAAPGVFAFHPANGGYRRPVEAKILQGLGVTSGVPDIIAIKDGRTYGLELKRIGGKPTDNQLVCLAAMERAGAVTAIAKGLNQAIAQLEKWHLLRGAVS